MSESPAEYRVSPVPKARTKPRPKKAATSPTARSVAHLESLGYLVEIVEHWIPHTRIRRDLWGFADLLAIRRDDVLAVQVTTRANVAARITKIAESEKIARVREANIRVVVHGWGKMANGKWALREVDCS